MDRMQNMPPEQNSARPAPLGSRLTAARTWAAAQLGLGTVTLSPVAGDASFRRYFRIKTHEGSLILMDAPPEFEDSAPFLDIAGRLRNAGLHAPEILHFDLALGFGLLEDLGDQLYRDVLNPATVDGLFPPLFQALARMAQQVNCAGLPEYDAARLQAELNLFTDWYLLRHKRLELNAVEAREWQLLCTKLLRSAAGQPQVFVHRDFHSSNLLYREGRRPGIIDFQDAVRGPLSYDFVSLLWDRYIQWPRAQLENWIETCRLILAAEIEPATWLRWCDLMGLQRNLKVVGIFSRLRYRDGKAGYLQMIPRFYQYLMDVLPLYPEFRGFRELLERPECAP